MKLSDRNWKPFYLSELFEIKGSKTTNISIIKKSKQGKYPYITTQTNNNAQAGYYNFYTEKGNILVIDSAVVGFCTYQFYNFTASDHVEKLIPKFKINKYIALFLTTQINKNNSKKFNYGFKACQNRLKNTPIFLPIDKKGNPDYKFMETYMREKENKLKNQYKQFISLRLKNEYKKPVNQKNGRFFVLTIYLILNFLKAIIKQNFY